MTRVTVAVCVLFVTAPAWAQRAMHRSGGGGGAPAPSFAGGHHGSPAMLRSPTPVMHGPATNAYLPPPPTRQIPTRMGPRGYEPQVPPSFVPGSPLAPRPTSQFTGYCGGRSHVTYASGGYYPHVMVYPIGGYYPTYYQTYPWDSYAAPELEGLAIDEGYLELHVAPDAQIAIDGRAAGSGFGEGQRLTLPTGYHWVEVARDGFRSEVYNVSIAAGRVYPLRAQLAPLPPQTDEAPPAPQAMPEKGSGTLALRVAIDGARVFVDGEAWGAARTDAAGFMVLPAGDHALRIDWPDGRTTITNVHVHDGDRIPLDLSPGN